MSLEDRLNRARQDYRSAGAGSSRPAHDGPGRSRWQRGVLVAAAAVAAIVAGAVVLADDDGPESVDVVSPDPTALEQAVVPDVISLTVNDARAAVEAAGLELAVNDFDSELATATVIAQEPPVGTELTLGGVEGSEAVGVRTALPVPPESADCPAMAQNRAITFGGFDGMPEADGVELAHVRQTVDELAAKVLAEDGAEVFGYEAVGAYLGEGVVPSYTKGPDGEPVAAGAGYHIVVEVVGPADCPDSPVFHNGPVVWFTIGWPST